MVVENEAERFRDLPGVPQQERDGAGSQSPGTNRYTPCLSTLHLSPPWAAFPPCTLWASFPRVWVSPPLLGSASLQGQESVTFLRKPPLIACPPTSPLSLLHP